MCQGWSAAQLQAIQQPLKLVELLSSNSPLQSNNRSEGEISLFDRQEHTVWAGMLLKISVWVGIL